MGIVTGIGDKSLNKNVIVPKIDADINDYILNKNCIINGLEVIGNTLTAGMCVLKGYRGILENDETLNGETYIYGKFTLNFDNEIPDDFDILKTNSEPQDGTINPASITEQGIYYLLLYTYTNGAYVLNSELNTPTYPAHAYEADETDLVKSGAVIESGVIATTQNVNCHDELDPDNVINKYVATTEYVHNQIEAEIDKAITTLDIKAYFNTAGGLLSETIGTMTLTKKARQVLADIVITDTPSINYVLQLFNEIPSIFSSTTNVYITFGHTTGAVVQYKTYLISGNTITLQKDHTVADTSYFLLNKHQIFGWETN